MKTYVEDYMKRMPIGTVTYYYQKEHTLKNINDIPVEFYVQIAREQLKEREELAEKLFENMFTEMDALAYRCVDAEIDFLVAYIAQYEGDCA